MELLNMFDPSPRAISTIMSKSTSHIGKGLIILLHGAPGVGKTSTAGMSQIYDEQ